jgi:dTDP-L-rhamnose 4-epimerase
VIFEDGRQTRDFTHVSDIVQALLLAMVSPQTDYQALNVGSGRALSILEVAQSLIAHLEPELQPEVTEQFRAGDIRHCYADIRRLSDLGYQPQVPFEAGITELVEWVQEQSAADTYEQARAELANKGLAG